MDVKGQKYVPTREERRLLRLKDEPISLELGSSMSLIERANAVLEDLSTMDVSDPQFSRKQEALRLRERNIAILQGVVDCAIENGANWLGVEVDVYLKGK